MAPMLILLNGAATELPQELTARELVEHLELAGKRIAMEVNGEILPRSGYATHKFKDGDKIELVNAIGGG